MTIVTRAIYFKSGRQSLFGWLHLPEESARTGLGVVICKPFGYEAICAHGSIRAFADACASAGATVLRFDYTGTGDSSGTDTNTDAVAQWCDDIRAAMDALRQTGQVARLALLGVRFGALLAGMVADIDPSVESLIAVAPVVSGRRYLRELRAFQATASAEGSPSADQPRDESKGLEVTGFSLSKAAVDHLTQVDLQRMTGHTPIQSLVIDRDDLPAAKPWADALVARGTRVHYQVVAGFLGMVATPHAAQVPKDMLLAVTDYLAVSGPRGKLPEVAASPTDQWSDSMEVTTSDGSRLVERALYVDDGRTLFAISTELAQRSERPLHGHGVVMLNCGASSHIGPNRMYVELARRWAALGYSVLRVDLAGLGDSATRPGKNYNEVYPPGAMEDVSAAINFLRANFAVEHVTLAGLCSGAYHALRSAVAGLHVNTVMLVNPLTFYWKQGSKLSDLQDAEVVRNPGIYAEKVWSLKSWRKVISGNVNVWRVLMVFLRRLLMAVGSSARDISRRLHIRLPQDLGWDLMSLASRRVRVVFLFARGEVGENMLRMQGGSALRTIGDGCKVHVIDGGDHIFSQSSARDKLLHVLTSELPV
jgi:pimeloyl-ACP methyl ester carboxylesterase